MRMETYLRVLVWAGRVLAVGALFLPFGLLFGPMLLIQAELLALVHRIAKALEGVEVEG